MGKVQKVYTWEFKEECVGNTIYPSHEHARLSLFEYLEIYYPSPSIPTDGASTKTGQGHKNHRKWWRARMSWSSNYYTEWHKVFWSSACVLCHEELGDIGRQLPDKLLYRTKGNSITDDIGNNACMLGCNLWADTFALTDTLNKVIQGKAVSDTANKGLLHVDGNSGGSSE